MPYTIKGGKRLNGEVTLQGSKHSYAAIMVGAAMTNNKVVLKNFPKILDSENMVNIFKEFNVLTRKINRNTLRIDGFSKLRKNITISNKNVEKLRDSIYILAFAPLFNELCITKCFGGCILGERPIMAHLQVLKEFGFSVKSLKNNNLIIKRYKKVREVKIDFIKKSVSVTKIAILISSYLKINTTLKNIALEPNVYDLINFLRKMGVKIEFLDYDTLKIRGGMRMKNDKTIHTIISDRMEGVTFVCAVLAAKGKIKIKNFNLRSIGYAKDILETMGAKFYAKNNVVIVECNSEINPVDFQTGYYPLTCTDMHPLMAVPLCVADGESGIRETIFKDRWGYIKELSKMGVDYKIKDQTVYIKGKAKLIGNRVNGLDIRSTASLIIAGLMATGETTVTGEQFLERAYDNFPKKLISLGANIKITNIL